MWANSQRESRPVEYRWRPLFKTWTKVNFAPGKIPSGGNSPRKCIYSVAAQEMDKHRAKFGWPLVSDVTAVTLPRRET